MGVRMSTNHDLDRMKNSEKVREVNKKLDVFIGDKVRRQRIALGMTQDKLASFLGVTFQQVQKYEKGVNRISASMLYNIATVLNVKLQWFVEGFDRACSGAVHDSAEQAAFKIDMAANTKESQNLLKMYYGISDVNVRKKVVSLVKAFSGSIENEKERKDSVRESNSDDDDDDNTNDGKWQEEKNKAKEFRRIFRKKRSQ